MRLENTLEILEYSTVNTVTYIKIVEYHTFLFFWKMPHYRHLRKAMFERKWSDRITGEYAEYRVQKEIFTIISRNNSTFFTFKNAYRR